MQRAGFLSLTENIHHSQPRPFYFKYNGNMLESPFITSLANQLIKHARSLRSRKGRSESGSFLVEGLHHVGSALEAGWDVEVILYAPDLLTGNYATILMDDARRMGIRLQPVSMNVMDSLAEKENPQGILAVVKQKASDFTSLKDFHFGAALVSPQDPGNVGAILRTLDAVGGDALFLLDSLTDTGGSVELYHPTLVRASMGTLFCKPVLQVTFEEFILWAKKTGCKIIGSSAKSSLDYRDYFSDSAAWILLLGSEQKGLTSAELAACDVSLTVPMRGKASSLNLAVAAGILLYEFNRLKG